MFNYLSNMELLLAVSLTIIFVLIMMIYSGSVSEETHMRFMYTFFVLSAIGPLYLLTEIFSGRGMY